METLKIDFLLNSKGDYLKKGTELKISNHASHKNKRFGFFPVIVESAYNAEGEKLDYKSHVVWIDENFFD